MYSLKKTKRGVSTFLLIALICLPVYSELVKSGLGYSPLATASLDFYVKNVNGNYVTDGKGVVKRYDSVWSYLDEKTTDSSGKATWTSISTGTYNFETYYNGTGGPEYWGDTSVTVNSGSNTYTFTRFMPFCLSVWIGDVNGTQRTTFNAGEAVRAKFTVKNNGYWTLSCKVRGLWDRDQIQPYDFDQTTSLSSVSGSGGTTVFTLDYVIPSSTAPGTMRLAYWIWTQLLNGNTLITDSWFWTTYTITIKRSGPPPDKSFVVLQFDVESDAENMTSGYVSPDLIGTIHDIGTLLEQYDLHGTFFVQGACFDNAESGAQFTQQIEQLRVRNEISSHFYSHSQGMGSMPASKIAKELDDTENAANMKFYGARVPYFDTSETIFDQLLAKDYIYDSNIWSGGDNTPYAIPRGPKTLYELPWRCSDHDTSYSVIKGVLDNYVAEKNNLTLVLHPEYIAEDWSGFSLLIQAVAGYKSSNDIFVLTSLEAINSIFHFAQPDVAVKPVDMKLPSGYIVNGTTISVNAIIHNIGGSAAQNFIVRFYDGDPSNGGIQIGDDISVEKINASLAIVASTSWTATAGLHSIYIVTDATSLIIERDELNNIAHRDITVYTQLVLSITPDSALMEVGQSQMFTSSASGGAPPYSYQWYLNGVAVSGGTSKDWTFTPAAAGTFEIYLNATDAIGMTAKSNVVNVTVNPPLSVSVSPASVAMNIGQSVTFDSSVSGGVAPYLYQWYLNETAVTGATYKNWTFSPTSFGQYLVYLKITDGLAVVKQSNIVPVTVSPELATSIAPITATMDVGQSLTFTSGVSGGTKPYAYQWYLDNVAVSGATDSTWTFSPTATGLYSVYVNVTDNVGSTAKSNIASITVNVQPSASISPTSATIKFGQSYTFSSVVSGGTPPYVYQWFVNGSSAIGATNATFVYSPFSSGYHRISLRVTDSVSFSVESNIAGLTVTPILSAEIETLVVSSAQVFRGGSLTVTVYIKNTGGEPSRFYVGASIIGEGENTWKDLPGWKMSVSINAKATAGFSFDPYVIPTDAYIGYHGIFVKVWSDSSMTQELAERWFSEVIEVQIPFLPELDQKIKLVFSEGENFFPVPGLYFDGDENIANNYLTYNPQNWIYYLEDRNGDGLKDAPSYIHVVEEGDCYVIECWLYYAYDSKSLLWFSLEHEHDFEYMFLWVDKTSGELRRIALNQHRWTNNYEFASDPGTLYIAVEKGGHGMILLEGDANHDGYPDDINNDGLFDVRKPDNCAVLSPELVGSLGKHSMSSIIASLYPWEIYDKNEPVEGFGEDDVLVKGVNYDLIDFFVFLGMEGPQFYLDSIDAALNTPILLASGKPWTLNLEITSVSFYIQAPWTRVVFDDPEIQWNKVSFEWYLVKTNVKIVAIVVVNKLVSDILAKIVVGTLVNQAILGLFDPVQVSIVDSSNQILGYKGENLVSEIPGGMIFSEGSQLDVYCIVNPISDYAYIVKGVGTENYNMTIMMMNPDGSVTEFNAKLIPIGKNTQHKYTLNWVLLAEGKNGATLLIDQDGDGVYERTIQADSDLEGSELALPWWSNLWWVMAVIATVAVPTACVAYYRKRRHKKM